MAGAGNGGRRRTPIQPSPLQGEGYRFNAGAIEPRPRKEKGGGRQGDRLCLVVAPSLGEGIAGGLVPQGKCRARGPWGDRSAPAALPQPLCPGPSPGGRGGARVAYATAPGLPRVGVRRRAWRAWPAAAA